MDQVHVKRAFPQHKLSDDFMAPIIGRNSIATSNGKTWKMLHNAMAPALAHSHVKNLITIITEEVLTFRERLDKLAKSGEVFSMEQYGAELIFDVIARIIHQAEFARLDAPASPGVSSPAAEDIAMLIQYVCAMKTGSGNDLVGNTSFDMSTLIS